jgi:hypothetical protein
MADKFQCAICQEKFKEPRMLQCGHTFCTACIVQLIESEQNQCKLCKQSFGTRNATAFPRNLELEQAAAEEPAAKLKAAATTKRCRQHQSQEVTHYCEACKEDICKDCAESTHKGHDCFEHEEAVKRLEHKLQQLKVDTGNIRTLATTRQEKEKNRQNENQLAIEIMKREFDERIKSLKRARDMLYKAAQEAEENIRLACLEPHTRILGTLSFIDKLIEARDTTTMMEHVDAIRAKIKQYKQEYADIGEEESENTKYGIDPTISTDLDTLDRIAKSVTDKLQRKQYRFTELASSQSNSSSQRTSSVDATSGPTSAQKNVCNYVN